ncbi:MAG: NAD(P)-binding domain-containing protein [Caldilineaceae bacterium]
MNIAILGIGEAGGRLARDLIAAGLQVRGWDPNPRSLPAELTFAANNCEAVKGADVVLSVNWSSVATAVAREVAPVLQPGQLYADLNTAAPQQKREVAAIVEPVGAAFIDAAIMAPILPKGLQTPVYVSGSGAARFTEMLAPLGMPLMLIEGDAGSAATHKLVRSIMYKGVAAVVMECLEAGKALGLEEYARQQILTILPDEAIIDRFVTGSVQHAKRRIEEMAAVVELLESIGVSPFTSRASLEKLTEIQFSKSVEQ